MKGAFSQFLFWSHPPQDCWGSAEQTFPARLMHQCHPSPSKADTLNPLFPPFPMNTVNWAMTKRAKRHYSPQNCLKVSTESSWRCRETIPKISLSFIKYKGTFSSCSTVTVPGYNVHCRKHSAPWLGLIKNPLSLWIIVTLHIIHGSSFNRSAPSELRFYSTQQSVTTGIHQSCLEAQMYTSSSPGQTQKPPTKCQITLVKLFAEISPVIFSYL